MNSIAYLQRIRFKGKLKPNLKVLQNLQKAHLLSVPFENLDIHYPTLIELNMDKVFEKVVVDYRGGFCYELNGLFYELLTSFGFVVKRISARVFGGEEKGYGQEFDHLALIVTIEGEDYLTDVGFGEFTFAPLKMVLNEVQKDLRGDFVIEPFEDGYLRVCKIEGDKKTPEYIFTETPRKLKDYTAMCRYHQTSPDSHFTQKRLISLATKKGRVSITGDKLKVTENGTSKDILLKDEQAFHDALREHFRVKL